MTTMQLTALFLVGIINIISSPAMAGELVERGPDYYFKLVQLESPAPPQKSAQATGRSATAGKKVLPAQGGQRAPASHHAAPASTLQVALTK